MRKTFKTKNHQLQLLIPNPNPRTNHHHQPHRDCHLPDPVQSPYSRQKANHSRYCQRLRLLEGSPLREGYIAQIRCLGRQGYRL